MRGTVLVVDDRARPRRALAAEPGVPCLDATCIVDIYRDWIIPLNKRVQVEYLLQH